MGIINSCILKKKKETTPSIHKSDENNNNEHRRHQQQRQRLNGDSRLKLDEEYVRKGEQPEDKGRSDHAGIKRALVIPSKSMSPLIGFYEERDRCLEERRLFEDPTFPADISSLFFPKSSHEENLSAKRPKKIIKWLRPSEIAPDAPHLFIDGHSRFDVVQGELGDCWFLAAVACLTLNDNLFKQVVPRDQSFTEEYAGIFHFASGIFHFGFWQYGKWVDVVVDDRLPTLNGELLYTHSESPNEFWSALLEKAYAKYKEMGRKRNGKKIEKNGLFTGHAYSLTGMKTLELLNGKEVCHLRIRNPWGNKEGEWKGAWSDRSRKWRSVPAAVREEMDLELRDDGEFWISFKDFLKYFTDIEVCYLRPDQLNKFHTLKPSALRWITTTFQGAWVPPHVAGAHEDFPEYRITLSDQDPDDDDDLCTVIVAVMQKNRRRMRQCGEDDVKIGFQILKVSGTSGRLTDIFKTSNKWKTPMIETREVTRRFLVPPGKYIITPLASVQNSRVEFMLRIFTNGVIA